VLVAKGSDLEGITSLDQLQDSTIGVQIGSTSLDAVEEQIQPSTDPKVFDNSNDVVSALKQGQVDAIVVDLPTAIYLRDVEVPGSSVVGQFDAPGGDEWGALLAKDSPLTECVNFALQNMIDDGTLDEITKQWMSDAASAPELN
jgi:polar amino acid transport system substrate-binding protein